MKRLFTIIGALSTMALIALMSGAVMLASTALGTADQNKQTAVAAIREISTDWSVKGRGELVAPSLVRVAQTPQGTQAFRTFGRLGKMLNAASVKQTSFSMSTESGTAATIEFDGEFTNGRAKVIVKLHKIGDAMKVIGLETKETALRSQMPETDA